MATTQDSRKKFTIAKTQENLYSVNLANVIAKVDTDKMGTVYNPYTSKPAVKDDTAANTTTYPIATYTADADSLQVNRRTTASEHVDSYDWKSVDFGLLADRSMNFGKSMSKIIDGFVLNLPVVTAGVDGLDDGDFSGTPGNPKTTSNTNIDDVINTGLTQLHIADTVDSKKFYVVSPYEANDLRSFLQNTGNNVMDDVIRMGIKSGVSKVGTTFSGVDVFMSNNLTHVAVLGMATNPTNGDWIEFAGVRLTYVDTLSGAAGEIHIASAVDTTRANTAEAITGTNFPGDTNEAEATNTGYSALSAANQAILSQLKVTATNDNTADTLTITMRGTFTVAESLTAGSDTWGTPYRYTVLGDYGSINLYLPGKGMDYEEKVVSGKPGVELFMEQFYNGTIWTRMKNRVVHIKTN
jgi:hypothetical protein